LFVLGGSLEMSTELDRRRPLRGSSCSWMERAMDDRSSDRVLFGTVRVMFRERPSPCWPGRLGRLFKSGTELVLRLNVRRFCIVVDSASGDISIAAFRFSEVKFRMLVARLIVARLAGLIRRGVVGDLLLVESILAAIEGTRDVFGRRVVPPPPLLLSVFPPVRGCSCSSCCDSKTFLLLLLFDCSSWIDCNAARRPSLIDAGLKEVGSLANRRTPRLAGAGRPFPPLPDVGDGDTEADSAGGASGTS
jgi:hypothetical protein